MGGQGLSLSESGHCQRMDGGFGTACDHNVGIVPHNQAGGVSDRMSPRRTSRNNGMVRSVKSVLDRQLTRNQINQARRDKERADFTGTAFFQGNGAVGNRGQTADSRADHDARAESVFFGFGFPS